jgi:HEAT repeat protein
MRLRTLLALVIFMFACGGCGETKSTDKLIEDLKSSQARERIIAVRLLQQRRGEAAKIVPALIEALKDSEGDVRWGAAIGLGYFGDQANDAVPALQQAQHDGDARVREAAGVALSRIDPARFPAASKGQKGPEK